MGKILISENVSLDGVIQDPAGDEGFTRGGWVGRIAALPELAKVTLASSHRLFLSTAPRITTLRSREIRRPVFVRATA